MTIQSIARRFSQLAGLLLLSACSQAADVPVADSAAPKEYAALLKTYVTPGGVRYAAWKQNAGDIAALQRVADFYAGTKAPKDRDTALAWHINAYNSWILHNILAKYPTKGPLAGEPLFSTGTASSSRAKTRVSMTSNRKSSARRSRSRACISR